jgi:hypothetical protein
MGSITRGLSNNITTGGVILPAGITNASVSAVTSFANAAAAGTLTLLSTQTASASASISFTTGLDSTYDEYIFKFIDIHPASSSIFQFNMSTDGGSNYNVTKTTTFFYAQHYEDDSATEFGYDTGQDLAQSTAFHRLGLAIGSDNSDKSGCGYLHLFNPSSTTYVKHFIAQFGTVRVDNLQTDAYTAGYGNTTSAVNAIRFQMSSGNIDDGIIKLYGVKKS